MIVTYRAYIKKDYKPVIRWVPDDSPRHPNRNRTWLLALALIGCLGLGYEMISPDSEPAHVNTSVSLAPHAVPAHRQAPNQVAAALNPVRDASANVPEPAEIPWTHVSIKDGDNLSLIFDRLGLPQQSLQALLATGDDAKLLANLYPGQVLDFRIDGGQLQALRYEPNITDLLLIDRDGDGFTSNFTHADLETRSATASGTIDSSLFLAGQDAGLSDNLIMQMVAIFGWDIDFALDIRSGDSFKVVYQEQYKDGHKVGDGPILAAQFTNQGRTVRAVRYTGTDGHSDYYSDSGASMRKEFLRTPLKFTRISSGFSLHRKHPILNTIRAHVGVDYAAPIGTPVKATGDGVVDFVGRKGGYGRAIILRHAGTYSTLYGHLSRFASNLHRGQRVDQGQIIGYVGMSGLATGPHLHYEFRINGVHHDPLTVSLPRAAGIPKNQLQQFLTDTAPVLAQLESSTPEADKIALGPKPQSAHAGP